MDFKRVENKSELIVKTNEKYTDKCVITLLRKEENSKKTIKLNKKAIQELNVKEENNFLILFEQFNISEDNSQSEVETGDINTKQPVLGVISTKTVKLDKVYKAYEIALNTRNVKSQYIYDFIINHFKLSDKENNYIELHPVPGNAYVMSVLSDVFNKGEEVLIQTKQEVTN